jgi:FkbM family methyltransferase
MKEYFNKGIRYTIRQLEYLLSTGLAYKELRRRRYLQNLDVHYSRYLLFKKKWLINGDVKTVIDIGANVGEFTTIFAEVFPDARIYAFEPLPDCFAQLSKVARRYQGRVKEFDIALGAQQGSFEFHRSAWAPASSFREMNKLHKLNYPHSAGSKTVKVNLETLDKIFSNIDLKKNVFIKMDVQGFEDEVIKGGYDVINRAQILVIECSLQQTYVDEPMFDGIYQLLHPMGFEYRGALKQSIRNDDQSFLQADCIFIKP